MEDLNELLTSKEFALSNKRITKKIGCKEPCPCGSGKKYNRCCGNPIKRTNEKS